jgi:hypothetical protein
MNTFEVLETPVPTRLDQTRNAARRNVWLGFLASAILFATMLMPAASWAQVTTATISGRVTDPTGAVVPKVTVTATEQSTGVQTKAITDKDGAYTLSFLKTGTYTITAEAKGFTKFIESGLALSSVDHPTIDVKLAVGSDTNSVVVTADPPLLATEDANIGQTVPRQLVEDLPLSGRTPMSFAQYTVGVTATANPVGTRPFDNSAVAAFSVGGLPNKNAEILMDGSPDNASDNAPAYELPLDAAQEITIKIFASDASYGHSGGAVANQITKSGGNRFHGTLSEFNQNNDLNALGYFLKRQGIKNAVTRQNQFGGTIGGPIIIPKLYDGRDKLQFFFAYEGFYDSSANPVVTTVPTAAERTGDFSALIAAGNNGYYRSDPECKSGNTTVYSPYYFTNQIYDPATGVVNAACKALGFTVYDRQPFANNILTSGKLPLSKVALAALKYFPMPTNPNAYLGYLNYSGVYNSGDRYNNELGRLDFKLSPRQSLYFTGRHNQRLQYLNQQFGNSDPALGDFLYRLNYGFSAGDIVTVNQTTVAEVRLNYTRYSQPTYTAGDGFDPSTLGLPSLPSAHPMFPRFNFNDYGFQNGTQQSLGVTTQSPGTAPFNSEDVFIDVIKTKGLHVVKFGVDFRKFQKGNFTFANSGGSYNFDNGFTSSFGGNASNQGYQADFASFMLGLVSNWYLNNNPNAPPNANAPGAATYDFNTHSIGNQSYLGLFVQDDWRIRPNLTLNFGLRMDKDFSPNEREGTAVAGFDMTDTNPYSGAVTAAYAAHPNSLLPVANFKVLGGLQFNSPGNTKFSNFPSIDFSPRVGLSYSPTYLKNTVVRAGFGIFVLPIFPFNNSISQNGFSQTTLSPTVLFAPPTAGQAGTLDNPFPNGLAAPTGSLAGLATSVGSSINFLDPKIVNGYAERWHLGFQRQFARNWMVDVFYEGSTGRKLPINKALNYVQPQYETTASNPTLGASVTNPFLGLIPNGGSLNYNPTIPLTTLLQTYPEFGSIGEINVPAGSSIFNSLDVHVEHRTGYGLSMFANFQWSKEIEAVTYLNPGDAHLERRISQYDHPEHAVIALSYQLPYGKGRRFGHHAGYLLDLPLGGWNISSSYFYQQGAPIALPNIIVNPGVDLHYYSRQATENGGGFATCPALNINYFQDNASNSAICGVTNQNNANGNSYQTLSNNIRTLHSQFGGFRADAWNDWDASILKNFNITEHSYFQLRIDGFNVNNRPVFGTPNLTASSGSFGQILSTANGNNGARFFQVGGRISF